MFNIGSKYFSFFNNKALAKWVMDITRDFLKCYFCSYYSSMETSIAFRVLFVCFLVVFDLFIIALCSVLLIWGFWLPQNVLIFFGAC